MTMRRIWRAIGLVAVLVTQACWLQAGGGPQRQGFTGLATGVTTANVGELTEAWANPGWLEDDPREALVDGGRVYIRTADRLRVIDGRTGATLWTQDDFLLHGSQVAAVVGGRLYVPLPGGACYLATVDVETGSVLDKKLVSPPDLNNGFDGYSDCTASDAVAVGSTVAFRWNYRGTAPSSQCPGGAAILGGPGVTATDVDGGPDGWVADDLAASCGEVPIPASYGDISSAGSGGAVAVVSDGVRQLGCTGDGCPEPWSVTAAGTTVGPPVVLDNGDVAVAKADGRVLVIDGTSHAVEWTGELGSAISQPLASDRDTIFATAADGRLVAFPIEGCSAATCPGSWTAVVTSPASARPSIGADVVYVGSADGSVSAFDAAGCGAATCPSLWRGTTPAEITGAPVISGGQVIVGSSNGVVTAFALPDAVAGG
jgi:hypothetical protein